MAKRIRRSSKRKLSKRVSKRMSNRLSKRVTNRVSKRVSKRVYKRVSKRLSKRKTMRKNRTSRVRRRSIVRRKSMRGGELPELDAENPEKPTELEINEAIQEIEGILNTLPIDKAAQKTFTEKRKIGRLRKGDTVESEKNILTLRINGIKDALQILKQNIIGDIAVDWKEYYELLKIYHGFVVKPVMDPNQLMNPNQLIDEITIAFDAVIKNMDDLDYERAEVVYSMVLDLEKQDIRETQTKADIAKKKLMSLVTGQPVYRTAQLIQEHCLSIPTYQLKQPIRYGISPKKLEIRKKFNQKITEFYGLMIQKRNKGQGVTIEDINKLYEELRSIIDGNPTSGTVVNPLLQ